MIQINNATPFYHTWLTNISDFFLLSRPFKIVWMWDMLPIYDNVLLDESLLNGMKYLKFIEFAPILSYIYHIKLYKCRKGLIY